MSTDPSPSVCGRCLCVFQGIAALTLEMVSGMLKSFPPCSLKPQGAGPFRVTVYELIFSCLSPPALPVPVLSPVPAVLLSCFASCVSPGFPSLPCPSWRWWGWVGQELRNLCDNRETGTNPCTDEQTEMDE